MFSRRNSSSNAVDFAARDSGLRTKLADATSVFPELFGAESLRGLQGVDQLHRKNPRLLRQILCPHPIPALARVPRLLEEAANVLQHVLLPRVQWSSSCLLKVPLRHAEIVVRLAFVVLLHG